MIMITVMTNADHHEHRRDDVLDSRPRCRPFQRGTVQKASLPRFLENPGFRARRISRLDSAGRSWPRPRATRGGPPPRQSGGCDCPARAAQGRGRSPPPGTVPRGAKFRRPVGKISVLDGRAACGAARARVLPSRGFIGNGGQRAGAARAAAGGARRFRGRANWWNTTPPVLKRTGDR